MSLDSEEKKWIKDKVREYEELVFDLNEKASKEMYVCHDDFETYRDSYRFFYMVFFISTLLSFFFVFVSVFYIVDLESASVYTSSTNGDIALIKNFYER